MVQGHMMQNGSMVWCSMVLCDSQRLHSIVTVMTVYLTRYNQIWRFPIYKCKSSVKNAKNIFLMLNKTNNDSSCRRATIRCVQEYRQSIALKEFALRISSTRCYIIRYS